MYNCRAGHVRLLCNLRKLKVCFTSETTNAFPPTDCWLTASSSLFNVWFPSLSAYSVSSSLSLFEYSLINIIIIGQWDWPTQTASSDMVIPSRKSSKNMVRLIGIFQYEGTYCMSLIYANKFLKVIQKAEDRWPCQSHVGVNVGEREFVGVSLSVKSQTSIVVNAITKRKRKVVKCG